MTDWQQGRIAVDPLRILARRAAATSGREMDETADVIDGVVMPEPDFAKWAQAMIECTSEFDFIELPELLRDRLVDLCHDIHYWGEATRIDR